ncbi:MAG: hypothetical protein CSA81_06720 [Acidobacteria bacterium]|nr:MAG: hypothetical protein CSA81_06720 [Acidobacteriota bacterium]
MKIPLCIITLILISCTPDPSPLVQQNKEQPVTPSFTPEQVPEICSGLMESIASGDQTAFQEQLEVCAQSKEDDILPFLLSLLEQDQIDGLVKMDLIMTVGDRGDTRAVDPLIRLLRKDFRERKGFAGAIIPALGALKAKSAVPIITEALLNTEDHWLYRNMAARALGSIGDPSATEALVTASHIADARDDAIQALANMGDETCIPILIEAVNSEEAPETRTAAMFGLKRLGNAAVSPIEDAVINFYGEFPAVESRKMLVHVLAEIDNEQAKTALAKIAAREDDHAVTLEAHSLIKKGKEPPVITGKYPYDAN